MSDATENAINFEQVRIPIYDANNIAVDSRMFAKGLQKFFKAAPFNYEIKLILRTFFYKRLNNNSSRIKCFFAIL